MSYSVAFTDKNKTPIVVDDDTVNTTATDITLFGRSELKYGQALQENLLHLLENFALPADATGVAPNTSIATDNLLSKPVVGQTWFNKTDSRIYGYNGIQWLPLSSRGDIAANWGVIANGQQLPLPVGSNGETFNYSECIWIVSPFNLPKEVNSLFCETDANANVTMQYTYSSDSSVQTGYANYLIIAIRNNINFVPPPVSGTPTPSPTPSLSPPPGVTSTPTPTPSKSLQPTPTATSSATMPVTPTPAVTMTRTMYSSPTPTPSNSPSASPAPLVVSVALNDTCVYGGCYATQDGGPCTAYGGCPIGCIGTDTNGTTLGGVITGGNGHYTIGYTYMSGSTNLYTISNFVATSAGSGKYNFTYNISSTQNSTANGGPTGATYCDGSAAYGTTTLLKIWIKDTRGTIVYSSPLKITLQYLFPLSGGGGGCAEINSYTPVEGKLIGDYALGHMITACRHQDLSVVSRQVSRSYYSMQPCFRLHMECGATVIISASTPLEGKDVRFFPSDSLGHKLPTMNAKTKEVNWDTIKQVEYVGEKEVNRISLSGEDLNYFAGETPEWFVSVHNVAAEPTKPLLFTVGTNTIKKN